MLKSLNLIKSGNYKNPKITECIALLLDNVVLRTYPFEVIDCHLKAIVRSELDSYCGSDGVIMNLEDMWLDLIFMNYVLHFKSIIRNYPEINGEEVGNFEYGVHIPGAEMIERLLKACIEAISVLLKIDPLSNEANEPPSVRTDIGMNVIGVLLKIAKYSAQSISRAISCTEEHNGLYYRDPETWKGSRDQLVSTLVKFIVHKWFWNVKFFATSQEEASGKQKWI